MKLRDFGSVSRALATLGKRRLFLGWFTVVAGEPYKGERGKRKAEAILAEVRQRYIEIYGSDRGFYAV